MKLAAVVILYHPDKSVIANIKTYYNFFDRIFIFDNTESECLIKQELADLAKINFYFDNQNSGIAARLNAACEIAIQEKFDWILTMDQDTSFSEDAILYYLNCFHQYKSKENVAMFGTNYSRNSHVSFNKCECLNKDELITAGTLLNLSLFREIGGFDEALFIDSIDSDYCIRAKTAGYFIIQFSNIYILHNVGKWIISSSIKTFFLVKKEKMVHSPLRIYYMYRNMLYLEKKYKSLNLKLVQNIRERVITHIKRCIFYGRNTRKIISYLRKAKKDFKNGKMAKIEQEL